MPVIWSSLCSISLNNWRVFLFHHFLYGIYQTHSHNRDQTHAELILALSGDLRPNWQKDKRKKNFSGKSSLYKVHSWAPCLKSKPKKESLVRWCIYRSFICNIEIILTSIVLVPEHPQKHWLHLISLKTFFIHIGKTWGEKPNPRKGS